jgi:hypothetical protein
MLRLLGQQVERLIQVLDFSCCPPEVGHANFSNILKALSDSKACAYGRALALRQVAADPSGRRTAGRLAKSEGGEHDDLDVDHKLQSSAAIKPKIFALCCVLAEHLGEGGWHRPRRLWVITRRVNIY